MSGKYTDMLNLSYTKRWVIAPMYREQSVAEHSYRVSVIARFMFDFVISHSEQPMAVCSARENLLICALEHDMHESTEGDIPGPAKDKNKPWADPRLLPIHEQIVKVADSIEAWSWWWMHGNLMWDHEFSPGKSRRDAKKIAHYTAHWPELRKAARAVFTELFQSTIPEEIN